MSVWAEEVVRRDGEGGLSLCSDTGTHSRGKETGLGMAEVTGTLS